VKVSSYKQGDQVVRVDADIERSFTIIEGIAEIKWKREGWRDFSIGRGFYAGVVESFLNESSSFTMTAKTDLSVSFFERDAILSCEDEEVSLSVLKSLSLLNSEVLNQKYLMIDINPEEAMFSAFESFVEYGEKSKAIETYTRFVSAYPESKNIDSMLKVLQNIIIDQNVDSKLPEKESEAYLNLLERINSTDPQENILILKSFEKKFPGSIHSLDVLQSIEKEYEKLSDEYQQNHYLRKILYYFPRSQSASKALFSLIILQRKEGEPEWYENALRFFIMYPEDEKTGILKKYLGVED